MKKTPEEKYIEELKEKALLHTVNFEGDMIVGKEQLAKMFKEYAAQCQQDNEEQLDKLFKEFRSEKYLEDAYTFKEWLKRKYYLTTLNKQ